MSFPRQVLCLPFKSGSRGRGVEGRSSGQGLYLSDWAFHEAEVCPPAPIRKEVPKGRPPCLVWDLPQQDCHQSGRGPGAGPLFPLSNWGLLYRRAEAAPRGKSTPPRDPTLLKLSPIRLCLWSPIPPLATSLRFQSSRLAGWLVTAQQMGRAEA